jgi:hypothetical protein
MSGVEVQVLSQDAKSDSTVDQVVRRLRRLERIIEQHLAKDDEI